MARTKGSLGLSGAIEPKVATPLDARMTVKTKAELIDADSFPYSYVGMITAVQDEGKLYILKAKPTTTLSNWKEVGEGSGGGGGEGADNIIEGYFNSEDNLFYEEVTFITPIAGEDKVLYIDLRTNEVYRYRDTIFVMLNPADEELSSTSANAIQNKAVTTTINEVNNNIAVINGSIMTMNGSIVTMNGSIHKMGGNIGTINNELSDIIDSLKKKQNIQLSSTLNVGGISANTVESALDVLNRVKINASTINVAGGVAGLDNNGLISPNQIPETIQYTELPEASAALEGKVYQYVGDGSPDYTKGYFYVCINASGTYKWIENKVQSYEEGQGFLADDLTAAITVGGVTAGDSFEAGTSYDDVLNALLNPTLYPKFTAPSVSLSGSGEKLLEAGSTMNITLTVTFNRGSISPAYGTSGFRAGEATGYSLNGGTSQTSETFTETVSESNNQFTVKVDYAAGEQPKDSKGNNYSTPLASGSITSTAVKYEFVDALWANTSDITTVKKLQLVSKSNKSWLMLFPAQTVANPEVFDVPASWTLSAIEVKNDLSGTFEDASAQFAVSNTTHDNAVGTSVNYKRYTFNLGYGTGARTVRIVWS